MGACGELNCDVCKIKPSDFADFYRQAATFGGPCDLKFESKKDMKYITLGILVLQWLAMIGTVYKRKL